MPGPSEDRPFSEYDDENNNESFSQQLQGHLLAAISEFLGTTMFLWFAFAATHAAVENGTDASSTDGLLFISLAFGFSLMVHVWIHYRISGGLFNPAVTLALAVTKNVPWVRSAFLAPAQFLGGIAASALISAMLPGPLVVVNHLADDITVVQGVFIEAFGTFLLIFSILMLAAEKHATTPLAPVGIGMALFVGELGCVRYTGGALNPARAFGPSLVAGEFPHYHYIYWAGPIIGALAAAGYYSANKASNYLEINKGQDSTGSEGRVRL